MSGKLTDRQLLFCQAYAVDPNATKAAIEAGYAEASAEQQGSKLLKKPQVAKWLADDKAARAEEFKLEVNDVLRELHALATADIGDLFDAKGQLKDVKKLPPKLRKAIASIETTTVAGDDDGPAQLVTKVKFWDKGAALEKLGRHLGLFPTKVEHSGKVKVETKDTTPPLTNDERRALLKRQLAAEKANPQPAEPADDVPHRT